MTGVGLRLLEGSLVSELQARQAELNRALADTGSDEDRARLMAQLDEVLQHSVSSLVIDPQKLSNWHLDNNKKLNPDQCHPSIYGGEKH